MLTQDQRKQAEKLLEAITLEIEGRDSYELTLGSIQWLAQTVINLDDELRGDNKDVLGAQKTENERIS